MHRNPRALTVGLALLSAILISACTAGASPVTPAAVSPTAAPPLPTAVPATSTSAPATTSVAAPSATQSVVASAAPTAVKGDPANGARLFASLPCSSCHDVTKPFPGGDICPNLGNIATEAGRIVQLAEYRGQATTAAEYIRESIVDPNAYIVPGEQYRTDDGQSVMPKTFGQTLTPSDIDDLVAFLLQQR